MYLTFIFLYFSVLHLGHTMLKCKISEQNKRASQFLNTHANTLKKKQKKNRINIRTKCSCRGCANRWVFCLTFKLLLLNFKKTNIIILIPWNTVVFSYCNNRSSRSYLPCAKWKVVKHIRPNTCKVEFTFQSKLKYNLT